ncbi:MAG TPA: 1-acyl-sn-glycerol-3-phosphate acyltransferase [Candidatus Phocaeicola excrementigallinarum]|nr:1-acyl-sn-glycerol-3-phosphate acyltransferase [Candidatus Phocaeicola excrementigallinarum]
MRFLYIVYQICIGLPVFLVLTLLTALTTTLGCWLGNGHFWGYYPGKIWSQLTCWVFLLPVKVEGHENIDHKTSYVFVANHQGAFDIFLIYGFLGRNFKWMMKQSLRKIPFVGKACESAGFIFVDRSSMRQIYRTIKYAEKVLQGGTSLVVFPEGRRTFTGKMNEFKKGAFFLADQLQLPVVPMTIDGSFDVFPRTGKLLHWHRMKLTIHKPIQPTGKGDENLQMLMEESRKDIEAGLPERYRD